jgi:UDP-glucose 4-epimerase
MKVLVTGAAGFLGKHVCELLMKEGHTAIGLDLTDATLIGDITDNRSWQPQPVDAVIHLAAIAAPRTCTDNPALAFNVNVQGTHQVLKWALESGAKKFVFVSSAHVYGISPKYLPTDERHPLWLQDTYTTTKILGEQLCELFYNNHGLSYTTLRLFNAYGPGQLPGYFIPDMIVKARTTGIDLKGGFTTKDFVYIDDVARAFVSALETPFVGPINIGTGVEWRLEQVAYKIHQQVGGSFDFDDSNVGTRMQCDFSRAKKILDWAPRVGFEEGLNATIKAS